MDTERNLGLPKVSGLGSKADASTTQEASKYRREEEILCPIMLFLCQPNDNHFQLTSDTGQPEEPLTIGTFIPLLPS